MIDFLRKPWMMPLVVLALPVLLGVAMVDVFAGGLAFLAMLTVLLIFNATRGGSPGAAFVFLAALAVVLIGLLLPSVLAAGNHAFAIGSALFGGMPTKQLSLLVFFGFLLAVAILGALRWPFREYAFLAAALFSLGLLKLGYVLLVEVPPVSDFKSMLIIADRWAANGVGDFGTSVFDQARSERVLLYLYPIRVLFGTDGANYQYVNVLTSVVTAMLSYFIARSFFGFRAARVTLVLALFAIEPLQAAAIPTHDIPGALAIMSFIALVVYVQRQLESRMAWVVSVLIGLVMVWAGMQRSVALVLQLALVVYMLVWISLIMAKPSSAGGPARWITVGKTTALLLIIPMISYGLISAVVSAAGMKRAADDVVDVRSRLITAHTESWGDGSWGYQRRAWGDADLPPPALDFAVRRLLSDAYHSPAARVGHYRRKAERLYDFGYQQGFYLSPGATIAGASVEARHRGRARLLNRAYALVFLALMAGGISMVMVSGRNNFERLFPALVLAVMSGLLVMFSEVQPRYLFPIWYVGAIYTGCLFSGNFRRPAEVQQ